MNAFKVNVSLDPNNIRFSQTSINGSQDIIYSMKVIVRNYDEPLPSSMIDRFTTKKGTPFSWGEALELRVQKQKASFRNTNPFGAFDLENMN